MERDTDAAAADAYNTIPGEKPLNITLSSPPAEAGALQPLLFKRKVAERRQTRASRDCSSAGDGALFHWVA